MTTLILIGICTYNRNELLENALKHINNLNVPEQCEINVAIADNNPNKDALEKGLNINADYIAFIDDDEYPSPDWISSLYTVMVEYKADGATSYPVQIIDGKEQPIPYNIKNRKRGSVRKICITNSVLFSSNVIKKSNI